MRRALNNRPLRWSLLLLLVPLVALSVRAGAQLSVRPDDPSGISLRTPRMRVLHSSTPGAPGTSMDLQQHDPWLTYQLGRWYFFREWGAEDGAMRSLPKRPEATSSTSCGMCHNLPFASPGAGGDVAIPVGPGRNAPHLFGDGLIETIGLQIRQQILDAYDTNHNGFLDYPAETKGRRAVIESSPGVTVDFGPLDDLNGDGLPDLNPIFIVRMVGAHGERVKRAPDGKVARLTTPGIVGYDLEIGAFATSAGDHQFPSMRSFSIGVFNTINGILIDVPVAHTPAGFWLLDWGKRSNAGSLQSEIFLTGDPAALKDKDQRGKIGEGELDLLEWYLMNHPAPAVGPQTAGTQHGRRLMDAMACTSCHTARWDILPADERSGMPGDRRFFDLHVAWNDSARRLEGTMRSLTREVPGADGRTLVVPKRGGFTVDNVFTDLRHHDLGERFWEYDYRDGKLFVTKRFRTLALWGAGSSAPYGHDGQSPSLDDVIRRHGGEAAQSQQRYAAASAADREDVQAFLRSLILYQPDTLPTDLDGDGKIDPNFKVAGREVGPERFWPEFMFRVPPVYRGWTASAEGDRYLSFELLNVREAYAEDAVAKAQRALAVPPAAPIPPAPAAPAAADAHGGKRR